MCSFNATVVCGSKTPLQALAGPAGQARPDMSQSTDAAGGIQAGIRLRQGFRSCPSSCHIRGFHRLCEGVLLISRRSNLSSPDPDRVLQDCMSNLLSLAFQVFCCMLRAAVPSAGTAPPTKQRFFESFRRMP